MVAVFHEQVKDVLEELAGLYGAASLTVVSEGGRGRWVRVTGVEDGMEVTATGRLFYVPDEEAES